MILYARPSHAIAPLNSPRFFTRNGCTRHLGKRGASSGNNGPRIWGMGQKSIANSKWLVETHSQTALSKMVSSGVQPLKKSRRDDGLKGLSLSSLGILAQTCGSKNDDSDHLQHDRKSLTYKFVLFSQLLTQEDVQHTIKSTEAGESCAGLRIEGVTGVLIRSVFNGSEWREIPSKA